MKPSPPTINGPCVQSTRRARGFSSADALATAVRARGVFVSAKHMERIESGRVRHVPSDLLVAMAVLLDVAVDALLIRPVAPESPAPKRLDSDATQASKVRLLPPPRARGGPKEIALAR